LYLKGSKSFNRFYFDDGINTNNMFMKLAEKGANVNIVYPETSFNPAFKKEEVDDDDYIAIEGNYKCTLFINIVRHSPTFNEIVR
jgi:hypothetical protein